MHSSKVQTMDYEKAKEIIGRRNSCKIANNTYLIKNTDGGIAVHLHGTDVVTYYPSGYTVLYTGGYETVTTKDRINSSFDKISIGTLKGNWTITDSKGREYYYTQTNVTLPDGTEVYGVVVSPSGEVTNCQLVIASLITDVTGVECTNENCGKVIAGLALKEIKKLWRRARDYRSVVIEHCQFNLLPLFTGECTGQGDLWETIFKNRLARGC